jgi:hypothetical protein
MKMTAFWDTVLCSLKVDRSFRDAYCLHHQGEIPECCHRHTIRRENP